MSELRDVRYAAGKSHKASHNADTALKLLQHTVQEARAAGHTLEEIGEAAGLTKQRIWQLTKEDKP